MVDEDASFLSLHASLQRRGVSEADVAIGGQGEGEGRQTGSPSATQAVRAAFAGRGVATIASQEILFVELSEEGVAHGLAQGIS